jgi:HK97 family phage portal protein
MSLRSRREERKAVETLKAAGLDVTKPDLIDQLVNGGTVSYQPNGSVSYLNTFKQSYARMYTTQAAFRSVVDFLSRNVGGIHMKLSERQGDAQIPRPDHDFQAVVDHPSPGVSYSKLMTAIVADRSIYGTYAVWKIRENFSPTPNSQGFVPNSGKVVGLVRIPIPYISIQKLSLTAPLMFQFTAGTNIKIRPEDMIWGTLYDPESNIIGTPPAETLRQILGEEWAAAKNQENMWKKGPHGNTVFEQDANTPGLDPVAAENFKTDWRRRYGGITSEHAGEIPLMPVGISPKQITFDAQDQQYLQMRNFTREEVCHAFGFNPALLGITPSNFASADSFHQQLYQDTLTPICVGIQEDFEEQLLYPDFVGNDYDFAIDFNINAKLQGSFLEQAKIGQQAVGGPWMTMNEFRQKFQGLPPIPDGDQIIVPLNVVRGGGAQANPQDAQNQFTTTNKAGLQLLAGEE